MSARDRSGGLGRVGPIRAEGRDRDAQGAQGAEVTTHQLTAPERAAWRVAVRRGLPIAAADVRELLAAAAAAEALEAEHQAADAQADAREVAR